jgi:hypothetical protein
MPPFNAVALVCIPPFNAGSLASENEEEGAGKKKQKALLLSSIGGA